MLNEELSSHEDTRNSMKKQLAELTGQLHQQLQISSAAMSDRRMFCQQYKEMKVINYFFLYKLYIISKT